MNQFNKNIRNNKKFKNYLKKENKIYIKNIMVGAIMQSSSFLRKKYQIIMHTNFYEESKKCFIENMDMLHSIRKENLTLVKRLFRKGTNCKN